MKKKSCTIIKYAFSLLLPITSIILHHMSWQYLFTALTEVMTIAILTNLLLGVKKPLGYLFNSLALLLMNAQFAILFWSNTFVTLVMLTNIDSLQALSGKSLEYGMTTLLIIVLSLLPISHVKLRKKQIAGTLFICFISYGVICWQDMYDKCSYYAAYDIWNQEMQRQKIAKEVATTTSTENEFLREGVTDYIAKPQELADQPNVILIFSEGLSQNIIDDQRNVMPNVKELSKKSIFFDHYFNHTFATYMGLSGQLHSGYQKQNDDPNYLTSLQDIFKIYGYQTSFINPEPLNQQFSDFLEEFEFDQVITDPSRIDGECSGMSDKSSYELLMQTALEQHQSEQPFFIAMYTFGTHVSFDSSHEKFGDGKNPLLNRFYNLDVQIGKFIERFEESPLFEDTILILTSDHAAYGDADFVEAYPDYPREAEMADRIPLLIYYQGVEPMIYDVNGRNSIDLAPTILDFLDMTFENCFLGESLFSPYENSSPYDTTFESLGTLYDTSNGTIKPVDAAHSGELKYLIAKYFAAKVADDTLLQGYENKPILYSDFDTQNQTIKTTLFNAGEWDYFRYAVWSELDDQDDLQYYSTESSLDSPLYFDIDLTAHDSMGRYFVHVYGVKDDKPELLATSAFDRK